MANYSILNIAGASVTSARFFQAGATFLLSATDSYRLTNPDGTIVDIVGTGFTFNGANVPTGGTISAITLYQSDFATQMAGFSALGTSLPDLHARWLGVPAGNVFNLLLSGNDNVNGNIGNDSLFGVAGNDAINGGTGDDFIEPGRGTDTVEGGGGGDTLSYADASFDPAATKGVILDLSLSTVTDPWGDTDSFTGILHARGTKFADTLTGTGAANRFEPLAGNDIVNGGAGLDQVRYNRDTNYGGALGVTVNLALGTATDGFGNTDTLNSIEGVRGTELADTLIGGSVAPGPGDVYELYGQGGDDIITAGSYDIYTEPGAGNDTITGGASGGDQVSYAEYTGGNGAVFDLANNKISDPYGGTDTLIGSIEQVRGTRNADTIIGNGLNNVVRSLAGNDAINGGGGTDQVRYDRDAQFGGTKGVVVNLGLGTATDGFGNTDTLVSIEDIRGTAQDDMLTGNAGNNTFQGLAGADTIDGGGGLDTADYGTDSGFGGSAGVVVNLAAGTATDGFGSKDTLISIEVATGTSGADTLTGGNTVLAGGDVYILNGGAGDDILTAGSHDALLSPGGGKDTVKGGAGFDQISYESASGTKGVSINLATGIVLDPFGFTATVSLVEGLRGTKNADTLTGDGGSFNFFRALSGADVIDGGGGTDEVRYDRDANGGGNGNITVDLAAGTATDGYGFTDTLISIENVRGSQNNDELRGDGNNNRIQPMGGADFIDGRGGQDQLDYSIDTLAAGVTGVTIDLATGKATDAAGFVDEFTSIEAGRGTSGNDSLIGGNAALVGQAYELYGMAGNDTIKAGSFDAYIEPGAGNDTITGGAGFDQVSYQEYTGTTGVDANLGTGVVVDPYGGKDTITGGIEALRGTRNADVLIGNDANNQFRALNGSDFINGGGGQDRVRYDRDSQFGGNKGVVVDLGKGTATDGFGNADTLISIEQVEGTAFADTLAGGDTNLGPGTSYELYGRGGDDILIGGAYSVYIEPGAGNDTVKGGAGTADQISYADFSNGVGVVLNLSKGSVVDPLGGTDTFTGIENARGTGFADTIAGDGGANQITGMRGADKLDGGAGVDMVRYDRDANSGGKAAVTVNLALGTATDGFGDADTLLGFEDVRGSNAVEGDVLTGNDQDNRIQGLRGDDTIDGGAGIDTVDYSRDIADGGDAGVTVDLGAKVAMDGFGNQDTLVGIENAIGTSLSDVFSGSAGDNVFTGVGGSDTFDGGAGVDTVVYSLPFSAVNMVTEFGYTLIEHIFDGETLPDLLSNVEFVQFSDQKVSIAGPDVFSVALLPAFAPEGAAGETTPFSFVIERLGTQVGSSSVSWSVVGSDSKTADAADFAGGKMPSGVASFAPGEVRKTITINVAGDSVGEETESFGFELGTPSADATLGLFTYTLGIIENDDTSFRVMASTANQAEGNSGTRSYSFTVLRDGAQGGTNAVKVSVVGAGAVPATAADFAGGVLPSQVLTFGPGEESRTFTVSVVGDTAVEADEGFSVVLSAPTGGAALEIASVTRTILNDDTASASSSFTIAGPGAGLAEGAAGGTMPFTFTVQRSGNTGVAETVKYSVAGNGATPATAADFAGGVLPGGTISFAAGETSRTVTLAVAGDGASEANEGFAVSLVGAAGGKALAGTTSTIFNDDTSFSIAATSANRTEGTGAAGATTPFTFTVSRVGAPGVAQSVAWSVAGVAGAGTQPADAADFAGGVLPSGVISFAAGDTSRVISVPVLADIVGESNDRFAVTLASPTSGAVLGTATAGGIILNDDTSLRVLPGGAMTQTEGNSGARAYSFVVQRLGIATGTSTVAFSVAGTGAAPADAADFVGGVLPSGTLTFAAGQTSKTVTVNVAGDTALEADEGFQLMLSGATGAAISGASAGAVIQSDDSRLSIAATSANKAEGTGAAGATTPFTFTVTRSGATGVAQNVAWSVNGITGSGTQPAVAADFAGGVLPSGVVSFAAGETSRVITVPVAADAVGELAERFAVVLTGATNGAQIVTSTAQGLIHNDDTSLRVVAGGAMTQTEGNGGARAYSFVVQRQGIATGASTVNYAVTGTGAAPATGADFVGGVLPAGTVNFAAGQTSQTVTVNVAGDTAQEADEGFLFTLSQAKGAAISAGSLGAVIQSDDTSISIAATSANKLEGTGAAGATTPFTFTVTRGGATGAAQSVAWSVAGAAGSGTQPADAADFAGGVLPAGVVSFAAGETSRVISVNVAADVVGEFAERFAVSLANPTGGAVLGTASAGGLIQNDDTSLRVVAVSPDQVEGNTTRPFTFSVQRQGTTTGVSTVDYAVAGAGANPANSEDFTGGFLFPAGTLTFLAGETSKTVTVTVQGDNVAEADEGFQLVLSNAAGAAIATASAARTIINDDTVISVAATSANKLEGTGAAGATTPFTFTVTRSSAAGLAQAVNWAVSGTSGNGTSPATAADFAGSVFPTGTITFAPGQTSRVVTVNVAAETVPEANDRFALTLSAPTNGAALGTASAQGIIQNDDVTLAIAASSANQLEGDGSSRAYNFTVTRAGSAGATTASWAVQGAGALPADAADFVGGVLPSGTVSFAAGQTARTVTVLVAGDTAVERSEDFRVVLSNPVGAKITTDSATRTILSDDGLLTITPLNATRFENEGGAITPFTFLLTRTGGDAIELAAVAAVQEVNEPGISTANSDFGIGALPSLATGLLVGQTSRVISINVADDNAAEGDEHFDVALLGPSPGTQVSGPARGIILHESTFFSAPSVPTLTGTGGDDLFILGAGSTVSATGGGGADTFRFIASALDDLEVTIEDFNPAGGELIDLSRIDAIAGTLANDVFTFNPTGGAGFSGAGSLVWQTDDGRVVILGDTNGDFAADLTIFVRPVGTPDTSWFAL